MARQTQPTAPHTQKRKSGPEKHWWRPPAVIAAIIAAIAAISVAFIQLSGSRSKSSEPTTIQQQTSGPGSPAVGHTGGNVTIQQQQGEQKP